MAIDHRVTVNYKNGIIVNGEISWVDLGARNLQLIETMWPINFCDCTSILDSKGKDILAQWNNMGTRYTPPSMRR